MVAPVIPEARIARAIWSFWTPPFLAHHRKVWASETHHLLSWVLSVETARKHYPDCMLVTDTPGARLLVEDLGLAFTEVSTELDALAQANPQWWVLGKLWTYRAQARPFVHIDSDVFLWHSLPERMHTAAVIAQNPEWFPFWGESWYRPLPFDDTVRSVSGWLPLEWQWAMGLDHDQALCCGILGGTATNFLSYYADLAIRMVQHPDNQQAWTRLGWAVADNILVEQFFLGACLRFHRQSTDKQFGKLDVEYLFESSAQAFQESAAARVGYTHLIGGAKSNRRLMSRLERRVSRDYPEYFERCIRRGSPTRRPGRPWPSPA